MFIICPKCSAKYQIPDGIKLENGQKLKCSACQFVFLKGEEEPLVLNQPITPDQPQETSAPTATTPSNLNVSASESLPEAFQPVSTTPARKTSWLIPIYLILILVLCAAGWFFRDALKPSFKTTFPEFYQKDQRPEKPKHHSAMPVRAKKVDPVPRVAASVQPVKKITPPKTALPPPAKVRPQPEPKVVQPLVPIEPAKPEQPVQVEQPKEMPILPPDEEPVTSPEPVVTPRIILDPPQPVMTPVQPEPEAAAEEEDIPLFDIVEQPVPAAGEKELSVDHLTFQISAREDGLDQVLIEGQLQNIGTEERSVPVLTVFLIDREGQTLTQKKVHVVTDRLSPGQKVPFYTSLVPAPKNIDHIDVKF